MKTTPLPRYLVRIGFIALWVALAAVIGLEFYASNYLGARINQTAKIPTNCPTVPPMDLGDLMAATP